MKKTREEYLAALRDMTQDVRSHQKYVVDDFQPGDALGVALLYYAVYGETFPIDSVYDPEELVLLNAGRDLHQVVGRTENGDIIGLYAIFRNPPGRRIMEGGSWLVHPACRNKTLAMRMAERIHLAPPAYLDLDVMFGQSVTDHLMTQKMAEKFHSLSCAIEIEAMPPRPEHETGWSGGRISLLDGFMIYHDRPHDIFLPRQYADILRSIYDSRGLQRRFVGDLSLDETTTKGTVQCLDSAGLVKITIDQLGRDFPEYLAHWEEEYPSRHVFQIILPLWRPGCSLAVEAARTAGYFLGGLLPLWFDCDGLLLQKVAGEPEFSRIQLFTEEAKRLLSVIIADRQSLSCRTGGGQDDCTATA